MQNAGTVRPLRATGTLVEQALRALPGIRVLVVDLELRLVAGGGDGFDRERLDGLIGRDVREAVSEDGAEDVLAHLRRALRDEPATFDATGANGDGRRVHAKPVRSPQGEVLGAVLVEQLDATDVIAAPRHPDVERLLEPPAPLPLAIPRLALTVRLAKSAEMSVILLTAPAGYGKTTLLTQWARSAGRPVVWITADECCDERVTMVEAVLAALDAVAPIDDAAAAAVRSEARAPAGAPLSSLSALVAGRPPFALVLDDAQRLASQAALEVVACVMDALPSKAQLVVASRAELDLPVGRLAGRRALMRLGPRELAFSAAEGAALAAAWGLDAPASDVEALVHRADGWPAALALAVSTLVERGVGRDPVPVSGRDRAIAAYMRDEVLRPLPRERERFLLESAVLDRLSGPLCDAVLERRGSAALLEGLRRDNVPLVALDEIGEWYRCNALLRDMLAGELQRHDADAVRALHMRASAWWEEHGDLEAAARHARQAGDVARAGELVARSLPEHVLGEDASLAPLLDEFEHRELSASPQLALARAWAALCDGQLEATLYWSAIADGATHARGEAGDAHGRSARALIRATIAADGVAAMQRDAAVALELEPPGSPWRPLCCYLEGTAAALRGERELARARLSEGERLSAISAPRLRPRLLAQLAALARDDGDSAGAHALVQQAEACAHEVGRDDEPDTSIVDALLAALLARDGAEAQAHELAGRALRKLASARRSPAWAAAQVRILAAEALLQLGDAPEARSLEELARRDLRTGASDAAVLCERLQSLQATLDAFPAVAISGARHLTSAELRVLRYLPTHLSFRQIGERLYLSRHTVKTEAISTYRKLGVNSRSAAVTRARELGLL